MCRRDPFYVPPGMRDEARGVRQSFCDTSDPIAVVRAFDAYEKALENGGFQEARRFAEYNYLSQAALNTLVSVKAQLLHELVRCAPDVHQSHGQITIRPSRPSHRQCVRQTEKCARRRWSDEKSFGPSDGNVVPGKKMF